MLIPRFSPNPLVKILTAWISLYKTLYYIGLGETSGRFDLGISVLQTTADYTVLILHLTVHQAKLCESNQLLDI